MDLAEVIVEWFDEVQGIGKGVDKLGRAISLNAKNIIEDGRFLTLKPLENIKCSIKQTKNGFIAYSIQRETKIKNEKASRDTFLPYTEVDL